MITRLAALKHYKIVFTLIWLMLLSSCGLYPVPFEGRSHASKINKAELYQLISPMVESKHGCSSIDKIVTTILQDPAGEPRYQWVKESWDVYGCNQSFYFEVTLRQEGAGHFVHYLITPSGS